MWASILGFLNGSVALFGKLMDYWSTQAIKQSGVIEERNKSNERTLERIEIAHGVALEPTPSDRRVILDGM